MLWSTNMSTADAQQPFAKDFIHYHNTSMYVHSVYIHVYVFLTLLNINCKRKEEFLFLAQSTDKKMVQFLYKFLKHSMYVQY